MRLTYKLPGILMDLSEKYLQVRNTIVSIYRYTSECTDTRKVSAV